MHKYYFQSLKRLTYNHICYNKTEQKHKYYFKIKMSDVPFSGV